VGTGRARKCAFEFVVRLLLQELGVLRGRRQKEMENVIFKVRIGR
jgi:hypothetical protein